MIIKLDVGDVLTTGGMFSRRAKRFSGVPSPGIIYNILSRINLPGGGVGGVGGGGGER